MEVFHTIWGQWHSYAWAHWDLCPTVSHPGSGISKSTHSRDPRHRSLKTLSCSILNKNHCYLGFFGAILSKTALCIAISILFPISHDHESYWRENRCRGVHDGSKVLLSSVFDFLLVVEAKKSKSGQFLVRRQLI